MKKAQTLKALYNLTPDKALFSLRGRLTIALLQLITRLLPGRFAVWLSLLDKGRLQRQVQIKFGLRSFIPGDKAYRAPRFHLIVERRDWLALHADALRAIEHTPDTTPSPQEKGRAIPSLKPLIDLLRRLDSELACVHGRIRINILEPDHTRTLTLALNDSTLSPAVAFSMWTFPARSSTASWPASWT